jgi:hypothetical protein
MKNRFVILTYYLLSFILIFLGYYAYIVPEYGYTGFKWSINYLKLIESIVFILVFSFILPKRFFRPSDIFLHLQFLFPILPMLVLYSAADYSRYFMYVTMLSFFIINYISSKIRLTPLRISKLSASAFQKIIIIIAWSLILSIIYIQGFRYLNFNFNLVYTLREDVASNLPSIYAYLSPLVSKVVLPFSLLLAVINKNFFLAFLSVLGSIMMFGLTAHKGPVFYPVVVLSIYFILKYRRPIRLLLIGYLALVFISLFDFIIGYANGWVASLMLRRTFLTPADINNNYYKMFSELSPIYWAESRITMGLVEYPYSLPSSMMVGREMYGFETLNANTGWIGSGFLNAGFAGMLIYAVIIGILFSLLNAYANFSDKRIVVAIMIGPTLTVMMSSDLPTAFLNHGVLLGVILLSFFTATKTLKASRTHS